MQIVHVVVLYIVCVVGYDEYKSLFPIVSYRRGIVKISKRVHAV